MEIENDKWAIIEALAANKMVGYTNRGLLLDLCAVAVEMKEKIGNMAQNAEDRLVGLQAEISRLKFKVIDETVNTPTS